MFRNGFYENVSCLKFFILTLGRHCSRLPSARTAVMSEKGNSGKKSKLQSKKLRLKLNPIAVFDLSVCLFFSGGKLVVLSTPRYLRQVVQRLFC